MSENSPVSCAFIACACGKAPHTVDWHSNRWIILASSHNLALVPPNRLETGAAISGTFCNHTGEVTCVQWIKSDKNDSNAVYAISGSSDKTAVLWKFVEDQQQLSPVCRFADHTAVVTYVSGIHASNGCVYAATCAADSSLKIWMWNPSAQSEQLTLQQTMKFPRMGFATCTDFVEMSNGLMLASGHDDNKVRLSWRSFTTSSFETILSLSGFDDWVRCVQFKPQTMEERSHNSILLASCSQDKHIRIHRIGLSQNSKEEAGDFLARCDTIRLSSQLFQLPSEGGAFEYSVTLDAILAGHEDWIYSVHWHPRGKLQLLSASMDKCLILWEFDEASGLWMDKTRLGAMGGQVAVGFYGGIFDPEGQSVLGHTFQGGLHLWNKTETGWQPEVAPSGHFAAVEDICWDKNGFYLLSCAADQSTRLFAPWKRENQKIVIHELARPQVHGHDMQCIASVSSSVFVSGAEEKILRAFVATTTFVDNYCRIADLSADRQRLMDGTTTLFEGASVPALQLSNKAVCASNLNDRRESRAENGNENGDYSDTFLAYEHMELRAPPTEDCLQQNTLWPEIHKLYGHGCEIFALASNHHGTVIASAAKATKPDQAKIILWSTNDWQQRIQLSGHSLTVTQIEFSPDDQYLLSVSRDRTWCLYKRINDDFQWSRVGYSDKTNAVHGRIIWSCAWSSDSQYFFTASRDKKVVVWKLTNEDSGTSTGIARAWGKTLECHTSATAVAVCPKSLADNSHVVAVGFETGEIYLYGWHSNGMEFHLLHKMNKNLAHSLTVKRLRFRPPTDGTWTDIQKQFGVIDGCLLASCSDDHSVKAFVVDLTCLHRLASSQF